MADPDWIGNPVEAAWWQLDGTAVAYQQKRVGSTIRDRIVLDLGSGESHIADAAEAATLDPATVVFDRAHQRALFVSRPEERRVGQDGASTGRSSGWPCNK